LERPAHAETFESHPPLRAAGDLDGLVLAVGPVGSAVHRDGAWDGTFGGEALLIRVREGAAVTALGVAVGGLRFAETEQGHLWLDLVTATNRPFGIAVGASAGVALEVDAVRPPRVGWQATVWAYAGVVPYIRAGRIDRSGGFVEVGLKIPLPAFRW